MRFEHILISFAALGTVLFGAQPIGGETLRTQELTAINFGSFVTTGPMLVSEVNGELLGHRFEWKTAEPRRVEIKGSVFSEQPLDAIEIILNGQIAY